MKMQNGSVQGPQEISPANSQHQDNSVRTALHDAAIAGDSKQVEVLLINGADRNAKDTKHGNTPLHEAAWRGYSKCVALLSVLPKPTKALKEEKASKLKGVVHDTRSLLHSALLGTRNLGGFSSLHLAAQNGHNQSCREILLAGGDADVQNNYGDTPLHTACRYGHAGATRILLSAKCDITRVNLNADTALHIAVAMGRRKLTKILLEAGSSLADKNSQGETVRDIALRKNLKEILEIIDTPIDQIRKERDRSSSSSKQKKKGGDKVDGSRDRSRSSKSSSKDNDRKKDKATKDNDDRKSNPAYWSPYGCHYSPDPREFPAPKLETLPKEPLSKGEQYYLDLAGNIRKGPIGVGNTCYCAPFFRHLEERISKNKKCIKKYVERAAEKIDHKVAALALKTDDQIEELTRSMIADRIRCENRRQHLEEWLVRGGHNRATVSGQSTKSKKDQVNSKTITRCKSLELLDDNDSLSCTTNMQASRSFEVLETEVEVVVHRELSDYTGKEDRSVITTPTSRQTSFQSESDKEKHGSISSNSRRSQRHDQTNVSDRLSELLAKTQEIIEMERTTRRSRETSISTTSSNDKKKHLKVEKVSKLHRQNGVNGRDFENSAYIAQEMERITNSLLGIDVNKAIKKPSAPAHEDPNSSSPEIAKENVKEKESFVHESSDYRESVSSAYTPELNPALNSDETQYSNFNTFYQNTLFDQDDEYEDEEDEMPSSSNNTIKTSSSYRRNHTQSSQANDQMTDIDDKCEIGELANFKELNELKSRILNGSHWRSQVLRRSAQEHNLNITDIDDGQNGATSVIYEIKNSEIKTLKTSPTHNGYNQYNGTNGEHSESSDDDQALHHPPQNIYQNYNHPGEVLQLATADFTPAAKLPIPPRVVDTRSLIPKDAYFHELPNKIRPIAAENGLTSSCNPNYLSIQSRTRNPLPYSLTDLPDTDHMLSNFHANSSEYQNRPLKVIPQREKLLSMRKFNSDYESQLHMQSTHFDSNSSSANSPTIVSIRDSITIDQAQLERDMNNDSGYSTKICGSSKGASPNLSGQIDSDKYHHTNNGEYFMGNIGASSLV